MLINFEIEKNIFFRLFYLVLLLFHIKYYEGALCQFTLVIHFAIGPFMFECRGPFSWARQRSDKRCDVELPPVDRIFRQRLIIFVLSIQWRSSHWWYFGAARSKDLDDFVASSVFYTSSWNLSVFRIMLCPIRVAKDTIMVTMPRLQKIPLWNGRPEDFQHYD